MPFERSSVLIAVALDGIGRHLRLSCKGETPIEGAKLTGSFQKTYNWPKKENTLKKKKSAFKVAFIYKRQELSVDIRICYFFQDWGNLKYFSTSQEKVVHVLVEDYTIK